MGVSLSVVGAWCSSWREFPDMKERSYNIPVCFLFFLWKSNIAGNLCRILAVVDDVAGQRGIPLHNDMM